MGRRDADYRYMKPLALADGMSLCLSFCLSVCLFGLCATGEELPLGQLSD